MNNNIRVHRHADGWVIAQAVVGVALIAAGLVLDRTSTLIIGVWLVLQAQLHLIIDELRDQR